MVETIEETKAMNATVEKIIIIIMNKKRKYFKKKMLFISKAENEIVTIIGSKSHHIPMNL